MFFFYFTIDVEAEIDEESDFEDLFILENEDVEELP